MKKYINGKYIREPGLEKVNPNPKFDIDKMWRYFEKPKQIYPPEINPEPVLDLFNCHWCTMECAGIEFYFYGYKFCSQRCAEHFAKTVRSYDLETLENL